MEKYLGVKLVDAELELKKGVYTLDGETIPPEEGYKVVYEDSYTSWSPKDVFEKAYKRYNETGYKLFVEVVSETGDWNFQSDVALGVVKLEDIKSDNFTIDFYNNDKQYKITIPSNELFKLANLLYKVLLDKGFTVKLDKIK